MTRTLHEIIGMSSTTPRSVLRTAVEARMDADFAKAASGDVGAQMELAELRFSYLMWAYVQHDDAASGGIAANARPSQQYRLMSRSYPASAVQRLHP
jgi:hypothetical protein